MNDRGQTSQSAVTPAQRLVITSAVMMASTMVAVDMTIANVALPHMQSAMLASQEQIFWTLTSYIVATAIATPATGWLANRFGRRRLLIATLVLFTGSSMVCGLAANLETLVVARTIQGLSGAVFPPMAQATMFDFYPREKQAKMMAVLGMGAMAGPILGPTIGGWLTDSFSWRWVFFVNLPFGLMALAGIIAAFPRDRPDHGARFDLFGFATVSVALGAFQLFLDRGHHLDWLDSTEVQIWLVLSILGAFLAAVHIATRRDAFIKPALLGNSSFMVGCLVSILLGIIMFGTMPLMTVMMQTLLGYSAFHTGVVSAPRGIGSVIGLIAVSRLSERFDNRHLIVTGLVITAVCQMMFARVSLYVDEWHLVVAGFIGGIGGGLIFAPLSVLILSHVPADLRTDGASIYALTRNVGSALGISYIQSQTIQAASDQQARLVEGVRPDSPIVEFAMPDLDFSSLDALAQMQRMVVRQATMAAYVDIFWLVGFIALATAPLAYLMRRPAHDLPHSRPIVVD